MRILLELGVGITANAGIMEFGESRLDNLISQDSCQFIADGLKTLVEAKSWISINCATLQTVAISFSRKIEIKAHI